VLRYALRGLPKSKTTIIAAKINHAGDKNFGADLARN
jgi:hypothetical protein